MANNEDRRIRIEAVRCDEPDLAKLARALILLAQYERVVDESNRHVDDGGDDSQEAA